MTMEGRTAILGSSTERHSVELPEVVEAGEDEEEEEEAEDEQNVSNPSQVLSQSSPSPPPTTTTASEATGPRNASASSAHKRVSQILREPKRKISLPERVVPFRRRTSPSDACPTPSSCSSSPPPVAGPVRPTSTSVGAAPPKRKLGVFSRPPVFNGLFQRNASSPDSVSSMTNTTTISDSTGPQSGTASPGRDSAGSGEELASSSPRHPVFSRIFSKPIQRSRSAGSSEAPAHALFLRQGKAKTAGYASSMAATNAANTNGSGSPKSSECVYEGEKMERKKKRSIGQDVRQRLSIFRRQAGAGGSAPNRHSAEAERLLKTPLPDEEAVRRWSDNFDSLLQDKYGLTLFHSFLKTEFSEENIEFWIACEEYKNISTTRKLHNKAQKIYNDYIAVQAPREVNLDSNTRVQTIRSINSPTRHTFDQAQKRIQALMDKDSYQRFLRSDLYVALQREVRDSSSGGHNHNNNSNKSSNPATAECSASATPTVATPTTVPETSLASDAEADASDAEADEREEVEGEESVADDLGNLSMDNPSSSAPDAGVSTFTLEEESNA